MCAWFEVIKISPSKTKPVNRPNFQFLGFSFLLRFFVPFFFGIFQTYVLVCEWGLMSRLMLCEKETIQHWNLKIYGFHYSYHININIIHTFYKFSDISSMPPVNNAKSIPDYVDGLIKSNRIIIFTTTTCPYCIKVKALFDSINEKYTTVELDTIGKRLDFRFCWWAFKKNKSMSSIRKTTWNMSIRLVEKTRYWNRVN
jgi:hypothetical protein